MNTYKKMVRISYPMHNWLVSNICTMVGALCLKLTKQVNKYPNSSVNLPYFGTYQSLTLFLSRNQYQVFVFILHLFLMSYGYILRNYTWCVFWENLSMLNLMVMVQLLWTLKFKTKSWLHNSNNRKCVCDVLFIIQPIELFGFELGFKHCFMCLINWLGLYYCDVLNLMII